MFQGDWRWRNKCQELAFAGNRRNPGACPAGEHTTTLQWRLYPGKESDYLVA